MLPRGRRGGRRGPRSRGRPGLASRRLLGRGAEASAGREAARTPSLPGPGLLLPPREAWLYLGCFGLSRVAADAFELGSTFGSCSGEALQPGAAASTETHFRSGGLGSAPGVSIGCRRLYSCVLRIEAGVFSILLDWTTVYYHFETRHFPARSVSRAQVPISSREMRPGPLVRPHGLSGVVVRGIKRPAGNAEPGVVQPGPSAALIPPRPAPLSDSISSPVREAFVSNVPGINGSWVRSSSRAPAIPEVPGPRLEPVPMMPVSPRRVVEAGRKHSPAHRPEPEGPREEATSELRTERSR